MRRKIKMGEYITETFNAYGMGGDEGPHGLFMLYEFIHKFMGERLIRVFGENLNSNLSCYISSKTPGTKIPSTTVSLSRDPYGELGERAKINLVVKTIPENEKFLDELAEQFPDLESQERFLEKRTVLAKRTT